MDESCANNSHNKTPNGHLIGYTSMPTSTSPSQLASLLRSSAQCSLRNAILFNFCIFSINYFKHKSVGGHAGECAIKYVAKATGEKSVAYLCALRECVRGD